MRLQFVRLTFLLYFSAFWDKALTEGTVIVSDPTTKDTPVVSMDMCKCAYVKSLLTFIIHDDRASTSIGLGREEINLDHMEHYILCK